MRGLKPFSIAVALTGLLVSGCSVGTTSPIGTDLGDYSGPPRHLIGVTGFVDDHVVRLGGREILSDLERDRLDAFVVGVAGNRPESLRVTLHGRASPTQFKAVADALVARGVNPRYIMSDRRQWRHTSPSGITVVAERAVAVDPNCPGWVDHPAAPEDNRTTANFGCADVSNFAAMLADPHQLSVASSSIYHDGERGAGAVALYQNDKVKSLPALNETFNVISSTGR